MIQTMFIAFVTILAFSVRWLLCRRTSSLSVTQGSMIGASAGDPAKRKIVPALFALDYEGLLPEVGFWHQLELKKGKIITVL